MSPFSSFLSSALAIIVLVALAQSGSAAEKLATCCKTVTRQEITEPILGYLVQERNLPCVKAVIFQTENGLYCSYPRAPWVARKIREYRMSKASSSAAPTVPSATASLLSIITSAASPPTASTGVFSSSSSSSSSPPSSSPAETGSGME